jgi:hypothetical protein
MQFESEKNKQKQNNEMKIYVLNFESIVKPTDLGCLFV